MELLLRKKKAQNFAYHPIQGLDPSINIHTQANSFSISLIGVLAHVHMCIHTHFISKNPINHNFRGKLLLLIFYRRLYQECTILRTQQLINEYCKVNETLNLVRHKNQNSLATSSVVTHNHGKNCSLTQVTFSFP